MDKDMSISVNSKTNNGQSNKPIEKVLQSPSQSIATPKINGKKSGVRPSSESELSMQSSKVLKTSPFPRATRSSQNPEFAAKQRKFLDRVHDPSRNVDSENSQDSTTPVSSKHKKDSKSKSVNSGTKRKRENDITPRMLAQEVTVEDKEEGPSKKGKNKEVTFFTLKLKKLRLCLDIQGVKSPSPHLTFEKIRINN